MSAFAWKGFRSTGVVAMTTPSEPTRLRLLFLGPAMTANTSDRFGRTRGVTATDDGDGEMADEDGDGEVATACSEPPFEQAARNKSAITRRLIASLNGRHFAQLRDSPPGRACFAIGTHLPAQWGGGILTAHGTGDQNHRRRADSMGPERPLQVADRSRDRSQHRRVARTRPGFRVALQRQGRLAAAQRVRRDDERARG